MTNSKNQNLIYIYIFIYLFIFFIYCISARSAPQTLSLIDEYTFRFSSFLITGLGSLSANYWFCIISVLMTDLFACVTVSPDVLAPEDFLSKKIINH